MNWLLKIASKEDFLFNKYRKQARALWTQHFEASRGSGDKLSDWASNLVQTVRDQGRSIEDGINSTADRQLQEAIQRAIEWNPKYADWFVGRIINEEWKNTDSMFYPRPIDNASTMRSLNDYLEMGNGQIPSLNTTTEEALALSEEWHKAVSEKKHQYKTHDVVSELSGGFQLVRVPKEDAKAEGYHMGHCVGSYCEQIAAGTTEIFSIRDANNNPHVTMELKPKTQNMGTRFQPRHVSFYMINQIQGKGDKAQPKYGRQVDEAIKMLIEHGVTLSSYGIQDYFEFQADPEARRAMLNNLYSQKDVPHDSPIFDVHEFAKQGQIPESDLFKYLEDHINDMKTNHKINKWVFFDYLIEDSTGRDLLLENMDRWQRQFVVNDADYDEDGDVYEVLTQDQFNAFHEAIQSGKAYHYDVPDALESEVEDFINTQIRENHEALVNYFWQEEQEGVLAGYLEALDASDLDFKDEYNTWLQYYNKQKELKQRAHLTDMVTRAVQKHDIGWTDRQIGSPYGGMEPAYTVEKIVQILGPGKEWDNLVEIDPYEIERALLRLEEQANKWWYERKEYENWAAQMVQQFPIFNQLGETDQWRFYNIRGREQLGDPQLLPALQSYIELHQPQQDDPTTM